MSDEVFESLDDDHRLRILEKLNAHNPKLLVSDVLPFPADHSFEVVSRADSFRFAMLVEELTRLEDPSDVSAEGAPAPATFRPVLYVFITPTGAGARNTFVSQTLFPGLCALIDEMKASIGAAFSARPIYFLDLDAGKMPDSVKRTLMLFIAMGVGYVGVNRTGQIPDVVPRSLLPLLNETQKLNSQHLSVAEASRTVTFLATGFSEGQLLGSGSTDSATKWKFHGSNDKFYWSEVLPVAVVAAHSGFSIDASPVIKYLDSVAKAAGDAKMSIKFHRTVALFRYIEKISSLGGQR